MKTLSHCFPNFAIFVVFMILACHSGSPVYAVNDSTSIRPVGIIVQDFSYTATGFRPLLISTKLLPAINEKAVNLRLKSLSSYEVYSLQHLPRQDFLFIRFSMPDKYRLFRR